MSATNPTVTVFYPPLPWLNWLPRIFWKAKHNVKLVRVAPGGSEFFDPHGSWIEMHFRGGDPVHYQQH